MTTTAALLRSLEAMLFETTRMLGALDEAAELPQAERRRMRQAVLDLRAQVQDLFDRTESGPPC